MNSISTPYQKARNKLIKALDIEALLKISVIHVRFPSLVNAPRITNSSIMNVKNTSIPTMPNETVSQNPTNSTQLKITTPF